MTVPFNSFYYYASPYGFKNSAIYDFECLIRPKSKYHTSNDRRLRTTKYNFQHDEEITIDNNIYQRYNK